MLSAEDACRFADEWIAAWNARDLPRVLSHYDDAFEMSSPLIMAVVGEASGCLAGKAAIAAYWEEALSKNPDLRFEKLGVYVSPRGLAIHFRNQHGRSIVETLELGPTGLVVRSAAHWQDRDLRATRPAGDGGG